MLRLSLTFSIVVCVVGQAISCPQTPTTYGTYTLGLYQPYQQIMFDASGSHDNDYLNLGSPEKWSWKFDYRGSWTSLDINHGTSKYPIWSYSQPGTYTVAVMYHDNDGQDGNLFTFTIIIGELKRSYFVKDHLGSIRMTVQGGRTMLQDDFSNSLSNWSTVKGSGFFVDDGMLANSNDNENLLVNSSSATFDDGIITLDVSNVEDSYADASVIFRYQNNDSYYMVHPYNNYINIEKRVGQTYVGWTAGYIDPIEPGEIYHLQITVDGATISVCWNGKPIGSITDPSPLGSGKVGFRQCYVRYVHWDNIVVRAGAPGRAIAYDDYDPWGMILNGRSSNSGNANGKYKFTGKERDNETGYDYFGARYYDSRIGRWLSVDPLAEKYPEIAPFVYTHDNPICKIDPDGMQDGPSTFYKLVALSEDAKRLNQSLNKAVAPIQSKVLQFGSNLETSGGGESMSGMAIMYVGVHFGKAGVPAVGTGALIRTGGSIVSMTGTTLKIIADPDNTNNYIKLGADILTDKSTEKGIEMAKELKLGDQLGKIFEAALNTAKGLFDEAARLVTDRVIKEKEKKEDKK